MTSRRTLLASLGVILGSGCRRSTTPPEASRRPGESLPPEAPMLLADAGHDADATASAIVDDAPYPKTTPKEQIAAGELDLHDWSLPGDAKIGRRAVVLVPRHLAKGQRVPLLVALHGLAETVDEELGAYAWVRRYGVGDGYAHLRAPDTITVDGLGKMASNERIAELRATLAGKPFGGMVIACPYTPNIWTVNPSVDATLDAYATWIFEVLVPRLRAETPILSGRDHLGVDGVSLGGYASLGLGVRRTAEIGTIGCVQAAISAGDAEKWTDRLQKAFAREGARPLHLLTSTGDVFRAPVEALDRALTKRGIAHVLRTAIGPHDQPFLRGPGSLEMLLWHARNL